MSLIDNVELYMPANSEIINIMVEEMESYFAGGKSKLRLTPWGVAEQ